MSELGGFVGPAASGALIAGRYRLNERLGRGGMGTVWSATDERMNRKVALKEPALPEGVDEQYRQELLRRMEREAQAAAGLRHPNIVRVHDIETVDGRPWLVMELIEGESLDSWFAAGTVSIAEAASIGRQLASALAVVHAAGVVHRDIKPANVMRTRAGEVILTDFGIAQVEGGSDLTRTGTMIGSVPYLSPERATGERPTAAADLWALGLVLYEALEGLHPYRRQSTQGTIAAIIQDEVPPPRRAGALTGPLMALLDRDPARRPTADEAERLFTLAPPVPTPTSVEVPVPGGTVPTTAMPADEAPAAAASPTVRLQDGRPAARPFLGTGRGRALLATATAVLVGVATAAGWMLTRHDGHPTVATVPPGYKSQQVPALGLAVAVPQDYLASIGADEASWSSPDTFTQIRIKDEGKVVKGARETAQARVQELLKGAGQFCSDPVPDKFYVTLVRDPRSVLHSGDVNATEFEYSYSTRGEYDYPCIIKHANDEAMEQYMVHDGRLLHLVVAFRWNWRQGQESDPGPANQQLYQHVSGSLKFG